MPKFRFIGDPTGAGDPAEITLHGVTFRLNGEPVDVANEHAVRKFRGSNHFAEVKREVAPPDQVDEKSRLIEQAEGLGLKLDRRMKVETMRHEIAAKGAEPVA